MRQLLLFACALLWSRGAVAHAQRVPDKVRAAANRIGAEQIARDLAYLSSDALRGRATFSPGLDSAAEYIIRRLRAAGLTPAGDNGTFKQEYVVREVMLDTMATYVEIDGKRFPFGDVLPSPFGGALELDAPVVYVGHGWRIPSMNIDAYAGVDVKGKIVLSHPNALPPGVTAASIPSDAQRPFIAAQRQGVAAVVLISPDNILANWANVRRNPAGRRFRDLEPPVQSGFASPRVTALLVKPEVSQALLASDSAAAAGIMGRAPNADFPASFQLAKPMQIRLRAARVESRVGFNVVAMIEGADPRLKSEYVTIAAHLDGAIGQSAVGGDSIYNAADDNASGSSGVLSIAEQMQRAPRPRRSMMFIWDSGEETGLWGTRAFVGKKSIPLENIVTHFNVDMIGATRAPGRADSASADVTGPNEVYVSGARVLSSQLDSLVEQTNRAFLNMRFDHKYDHADSSFFYPRTDAGPFLERGIPAIGFFTGLHPRYHRSNDEAQYLDPTKIEQVSRTVFVTVWQVANLAQRPQLDKAWPARVPRYP